MQNYKDIGELLAHARQEQHLSIAEISSVLHIRPRYLVALENGDISLIPGFAYAKGYLTRYATYLSLDRVEILRRFDLVSQGNMTTHFFMPHHFSHDKRIDLATAIKCTAAAIILLLAWALWVGPSRDSLPIVDTIPEKIMATSPPPVLASTNEPIACLHIEPMFYPPCIWPAPTPAPSIMHILNERGMIYMIESGETAPEVIH